MMNEPRPSAQISYCQRRTPGPGNEARVLCCPFAMEDCPYNALLFKEIQLLPNGGSDGEEYWARLMKSGCCLRLYLQPGLEWLDRAQLICKSCWCRFTNVFSGSNRLVWIDVIFSQSSWRRLGPLSPTMTRTSFSSWVSYFTFCVCLEDYKGLIPLVSTSGTGLS